MLPEIAAVWIVGVVPSAGLTALQIISDSRKRKSRPMQTLQKNLRKLDLFWAESKSEISTLDEGSEETDLVSYRKSMLVLGTAWVILSWLGVLFQIIVFFSATVLAVSRLERAIFSSALVSRDLASEEVREILVETKSRVMNASIPFDD